MRRNIRIVAADGRRPLPASTLIRLGSAAKVCRSSPSGKVRSCVLVRPYVRCHRSRCAAQVVRAETVALKGPMLPEVSTARTRK